MASVDRIGTWASIFIVIIAVIFGITFWASYQFQQAYRRLNFCILIIFMITLLFSTISIINVSDNPAPKPPNCGGSSGSSGTTTPDEKKCKFITLIKI